MNEVMLELQRCKPWIEAALEYSGGTHNFQDIVDGVCNNTMQLWPAPKACWVTEIVKYPRKTVCNIFLAGGDLDQMFEMQPSLVKWAKAQGCATITLAGRKGWSKVLEKRGCDHAFTVVRMEI